MHSVLVDRESPHTLNKAAGNSIDVSGVCQEVSNELIKPRRAQPISAQGNIWIPAAASLLTLRHLPGKIFLHSCKDRSYVKC